MDLSPFFRSVLEQDRASVVLCNLQHEIIYMNPAAAEHYKKRGGKQLVGSNLFACHSKESNEKIEKVVNWFAKSPENNITFTFHNKKENKDIYMVALRDENGVLIGYYEKHEYRTPENSEKYILN